MSNLMWTRTVDEDNDIASVTVVVPGYDAIVFSNQSPSYDDAMSLVLAAEDAPDFSAEEFIDEMNDTLRLGNYVSKKLENIGATGRVKLSDNTLYWDNDPVDDSIADFVLHAIRYDKGIKEGTEDTYLGTHWSGLVRFMEKVYSSSMDKTAQESLFDFLRAFHLTITAEGDFIAYKGVMSDLGSVHAGPGIVNNVKYEHAHLSNAPGNVVEIPRSYVGTQRDEACSAGLHVGTFDYANGFGRRLVMVKVNPRDVISVPFDSSCQKMRVCRYEVLSEVQGIETERNDAIADDLVYGEGVEDAEDTEDWLYVDETTYDDLYNEDE